MLVVYDDIDTLAINSTTGHIGRYYQLFGSRDLGFEDDNLVKKKFLTADLTPFATLQVLKDSLGKESLGTVDNIPTSYVRELSEADETALAGANALGVVKTWIKDYIEETVGAGNCSIITL